MMRNIIILFWCIVVSCTMIGSGLEDSNSATTILAGNGHVWTYDAVESDTTATKTQFSGDGYTTFYKVTEWNATGSIQEFTGSMIPDQPGAWSNRFIGGASEDSIGVHRLEMRSLGNNSVSASLSVDNEALSTSQTFESTEVYLENVIETPVANKSHLADRSRTYAEGDNFSGTFAFMAVEPPGDDESDWLGCACVSESFTEQPNWKSESIFGYDIIDSDDNDTADSGETEEDDIVIS